MMKWKHQLNAPLSRGNPRSRRARLTVIAASALAVVALAAGCSSSSSSTAASAPTTAASAATPGGTSVAGSAAPGTDVGLTSSTIHVALIADVASPVAPGLYQTNVDAVKAWAADLNASGGLAGRQVVVDFCDSKLDPNATTNCVIKACQNDFAMVGTAANALADLSDLDTCKNAAGQPIGIPNLAAFGFPPYSCDKVSYMILTTGSYCQTAKQNPQTFTENIGDFRYYTSHFTGLHGVWIYDDDVAALRITSVPGFQGGADLGIKKDGQGFYGTSGAAPQSALTPMVQTMKSAGSTFGYGGATPANTVSLRKEAQLQGLNSVKVWACNSGCYDNSFIKQGGSAVDGTYAGLNYLPFYSDYNANPKLAGLVKAVGGVDKLNGNAVDSYVDALLFQDAVTKAVANGGSLSRQSFFAAMNKETSFSADGIIGPTNVATHAATPCVVITQVQDGQWKRVYPAKPGTFDCSSANIATLKMNMNS